MLNYRFEFLLNPQRLKLGWDRDRILTALVAEGIPCLSGTCPEIYLEGAYAQSMPEIDRLPNAAQLRTLSLAMLVHPTLDEGFMADCCAAIKKVFDAAST